MQSKILDHTKQSVAGALKTDLKIAIKKSKSNCCFDCNKIEMGQQRS